MPELPDIEAVILDMDGLVLDTETTYCIAWQQAASSIGYQLSESLLWSLSGLHSENVERTLLDHCGPHFPLAQFRAKSSEYWYQHVQNNGIAIKKGFSHLIDTIITIGLPYCLATNSLKVNVDQCLEFAGLTEIFPLVVTRDQVSCAKPAPDIFLLAAELMRVDMKKCLIVEDSLIGIEAAKNARAVTVLIPSTHSNHDINHLTDLILTDLDELADIIQGKIVQKPSDHV